MVFLFDLSDTIRYIFLDLYLLFHFSFINKSAGMAELVDARDLKSLGA